MCLTLTLTLTYMGQTIWQHPEELRLRGLLPMAMAVFPVPGWPAIRTARPAIFPSRIISSTTPAARRAASCPTMPWEACGWEATAHQVTSEGSSAPARLLT